MEKRNASARPNTRLWLQIVLTMVAIAGSARLVRAAWSDSMDFHVYWKAAQAWIGQGVSPYLYDASDRGFVFKYPPWMIPFFALFGVLSFDASKLIWAFLGLFCIFYSMHRLVRLGVGKPGVIWTAVLFWWIWLGHIYSGQFTLILLATALWVVPSKSSPGKLAFLGVIFTTKVFSLVSLVGRWKECFKWQTVLSGLAILAVLHLAVYSVFWAHGHSIGLVELYQQWIQAATSGGTELGAAVVRGQMNHGFTGAILRALHVDPKATSIDQKVALVLALIFSAIWFKASRGLSALESWAGWLGVGLIVHPLAWHHSFVLAYPICAIALDRAIASHQRRLVALAVLGICCIGILIPNIFGMTLITPLELISVKSWGVCFSAAALVLSRRGRDAGSVQAESAIDGRG